MLSKNQVKLIRSLQQKKYRKQFNLFVVEGVKLVNELVISEYKIHSIYGLDDEDTNKLIDTRFPEKHKNKVNLISDKELISISSLTTPNRFVALAEIPKESAIAENCPVYLVLDGIRDPGNMGTIIRNADWFGVNQIICSPDCTDIYNPKTVQSSMGSIFRVNVFSTDLLGFLKDFNGSTYASVMNGQSIHEAKFNFPAAILIGNESEGIRGGMENTATHQITIPSSGHAESLNAAVASGIILYEVSKR